MNNQNSIEKMKQMRLNAMAEAYSLSFESQHYKGYTTDQMIAYLVEQEWEDRYNRKIKNLIKTARFRYSATSKDIDYTANRSLDKNSFERLVELNFMDKAENIIITGATGTGKSYLAQALGSQACLMQKRTLYYNFKQLCDQAKLSKLEGDYYKLITKLQKAELLILDDFGLASFDDVSRHLLMDIVEMKYDKASIIIVAQIPVKKWHETIGEGTIADAILDRLINSSHRIQLTGESLRKNKLKSLK